jgi:putative ABC transport system ATP-binding protein
MDMETNQAAIEIAGVEFSWDKREPLLAIEQLSIWRGERVFLNGPSGSGKSTLLALIGGVLKPQRGQLRVLGTSMNELSASKRDRFRGEHVGFIFQMFNLIPYLSVLENVLLPLQFSAARSSRIAGLQPETEALRLLEALGVQGDTLAARRVTDLSVGQQQRVAAARALIGRPEIVIADEPTSSLDADARAAFLTLLMKECSAFGTTLVFVSHDAALAVQFDRALSLNQINTAARTTTQRSLTCSS